MTTSRDKIESHELIGLRVNIEKSTNPTIRGVTGIIIDETKNTFKISTIRKKIITLPKKDNSFVFFLQDGNKLMINGRILVGRPEERIGKR